MANLASENAQRALLQYWDGSLPINPVLIAERFGVSVKPVSGCNYSGKAYIENGSTRVIEYNNSESSLRQRFTIAHDLGHHLLAHTHENHHYRSFIDDSSKFNLNIAIPEETQANQFAADLLMPKLAIEHFIFNKNVNSLVELAQLFSVSTVAMQYRLKNLGLL